MENKTYFAMLELRGNPERWVFAFGSYDKAEVEAVALPFSDDSDPFQIIETKDSPTYIKAIVVIANGALADERGPERTFNINIASITAIEEEEYTSKVITEEVSIDNLIIEVLAIENNRELSYDFITIDINP